MNLGVPRLAKIIPPLCVEWLQVCIFRDILSKDIEHTQTQFHVSCVGGVD